MAHPPKKTLSGTIAWASTLIVSLVCGGWLGARPQAEAKLELVRHSTILYEQPLAIPQDLRWIGAYQLLALHPNGQAVLAILPLQEEGLRPRLREGDSERRFRLANVRLADGRIDAVFDYATRSNILHVRVCRETHRVLLVLGERVWVLDPRLQPLAELPSVFQLPDGASLPLLNCDFTAGEGYLQCVQEADPPKRGKSPAYSFRVDWRKSELASVTKLRDIPGQVAAFKEGRLLTISRRPDWRYRYWIGEIEIENDRVKTIWRSHSDTHDPQPHLVFAGTKVFAVDGLSYGFMAGDGTIAVSSSTWPEARDEWTPPPEVPLTQTGVLLGISGRIHVWDRAKGKRGRELALDGYALHWPAAASPGEPMWIVGRATSFTHINALGQPLWDDTRFVIFGVQQPKKPLYVSENFGADEAILGLALAPDRTKLAVATSKRLIIYDVRAR